jgi:hypothetical protein
MQSPKANTLGALHLVHLIIVVLFGLTYMQPMMVVHPPVTGHPHKHFKHAILSLQI